MEHLIANSGIHFITKEIEFNLSEPLLLDNGKLLKYSFVETIDFLEEVKIFNLLYYNSEANKYIPIDELESSEAIIRRSNGREELDDMGMVQMDPSAETTLFTTYDENDDEVYGINALASFRVNDPVDGHTKVPAFDLLLDKWLPMPMFRKEIDGITSDAPLGWCRMMISKAGEGTRKGFYKFRLTWAFDTQTSDDEWDIIRPSFTEEDNGLTEYSMCNKVDLLLRFMSSQEDFHAFSDYIAAILGINTDKDTSCKYKAYYIYFLNYIRLVNAAPEIALHDNKKKVLPVDLVLDIGNSRTCGVLFEEGDFTKSKMLELRNLSKPWISYENKSFDMRIAFRKADFGNDIVLDEDIFQWKSFIRIGEEARQLVYQSLEEEGVSEKTTNYSSPKRYLWDHKEYEGQWENLITNEDPFNVLLSNEISVPVLSKMFGKDGTFNPEADHSESVELIDFDQEEHHYSRASLMTFAFIEIFNHAISQVNSISYRKQWGNVDIRRVIRNVIVTCPTAMPISEQVFLRHSAKDAYLALTKCYTNLPMVEITPSPDSLKNIDPYAPTNKKAWKYDEASCCQLVYLYAEIAQRYNGEIYKFFELKGHKRKKLQEEGYNEKALTIGTIDIGAGTTDIMVCTYEHEGNTTSKITPIPLFWDSFYLAGDDILRSLIQNLIIEGKELPYKDLGNITSALIARIIDMKEEELKAMPCLDNIVYKNKVDDICLTLDEELKREKKLAFASNLIHDFFGADSSMMGYRDRQCRNDFNTQVSVPIAQKMMELLRTHRPSKQYSFDELFPDIKPAGYLLDYFEHHFGFRFEQLNWRYDPVEVSDIVKSTMEPLMKQLALVLYSVHCDIIVLAGRPTSLDAITELFIKYIPVSPDRLVKLNDYRVGAWFPTADGQGYFYDQKTIVAVGGMVAYLSSHSGLKGLVIDFDKMIQKMNSTANYIGEYNSQRRQVSQTLLSPTTSSAAINISVFPAFLGCRQLDSPIYQARPLYAIINHGTSNSLQVRLSRNFTENKEILVLEEATDKEFRNRKNELELVPLSFVEGKYWLDKGEFELSIK